jgi:hypothetical protein
MKRILEFFEEMMVAVAFAEEGVNLFEIKRTNYRAQSAVYAHRGTGDLVR